MLKSLEIKNIALIDRAIIEFGEGLNVLSGETGAGKSVILESLNFVLGAKADKSMIRHGESECSVTAVFDISDLKEAGEAIRELGLDGEDEVVVTRKYSLDGKGGIRVNGETFTVNMLKSVTPFLVDIHGQSEHYLLMNKAEQLKTLDRYSESEIGEVKSRLSEIVEKLKATDKNLTAFGGNESERAIRADILKFQIEEIENAAIKEGEEEELSDRRYVIMNAEKISEALNAARQSLGGEDCALDALNAAVRSLDKISSLNEKYSALAERLRAIVEETSDIEGSIDDLSGDFEFDEYEADKIEERLDLIKSLKKKYGSSAVEIDEFLTSAKSEYERLVNFDAEYSRLTSERQKLLDEYNSVNDKLTAIRKIRAEEFSDKVKKQLVELGMKNADFTVYFSGAVRVTDPPYPLNGTAEAEFMFSANLGEPLKPLSKIISGGEMSRFMLALKAITSEYHGISTYVFDEIDAGLSGSVAWIVAEKFIKISKNIQIVAISHLPQICAASDNSLFISKDEKEGKTYTSVKTLVGEEKIEELVRLSGGGGDAAKLHAEEMIAAADDIRQKYSK
ncbi:MAG: DNA repair protein RecN [Clostridia bacterium]|nr:DNA repair protein RecN [Clostridia bacterium]